MAARETETDKLMRLMAKCPSLAKALVGSQTTFDDEAEPTDDDLSFITRVRGAPRPPALRHDGFRRRGQSRSVQSSDRDTAIPRIYKKVWGGLTCG